MTHEAFLRLVWAVTVLARHAPPKSDVHGALAAVYVELNAETGRPKETDLVTAVTVTGLVGEKADPTQPAGVE